MEMLKASDILVLCPNDCWESKMIARLTYSDAWRSVMMLDSRWYIGMTETGVEIDDVEKLDVHGASLLRLSPERSAFPLIEDAKKSGFDSYYTKYSFPKIVYMAGYIIHNEICPTPECMAITERILRGACMALDKLLQSKSSNRTVTIFSQIVYQLYKNCGNEYQIQINKRQAWGSGMSNGYIRLADIARDAPGLEQCGYEDTSAPNIEELSKKMYIALTEGLIDPNAKCTLDTLGCLPSLARCVLNKVEEVLKQFQSNISIDEVFITPADLVYNSTNLNFVTRL